MDSETEEKCNSLHKLGGMRCIREKGHEGRCWCKATRDSAGAMTRGEWISKGGVFVRHVQYVTTYPKNGKPRGEPQC